MSGGSIRSRFDSLARSGGGQEAILAPGREPLRFAELAARLLAIRNAFEDMSLYVSNVSRLAEAIDATALIVHHAGKDPTRGARGSSSLKAAVNVEIEIARRARGGDA
jgi:hypothetical protein